VEVEKKAMNRWIRNALLTSSLVGALALVPGAVAFASDAAQADSGAHGHRGQGPGLLGAALEIDSLTSDQRTAIEKLAQGRRAAGAPVRAADAQMLTVLAQQVERARIEPQGLAASLAAERSAADAQAASERDALNQLHSILTSAQRGQLVDALTQGHAAHSGGHGKGHHEGGEARWLGHALELSPGQESEIQANLTAAGSAAGDGGARGEHGKMLAAFRGDSFDASAFVKAHNRGEQIEKLAAAAVPVLTPSQRATFADHLRRRAAHESKQA
jgi:Spy/CpxP family protein refolding chaperone